MTAPAAAPVIIGRSSSHFTRLTRIFAAELGVLYSFRTVRDLLDLEQETYGGNPALKIPILVLDGRSHFGSLNICRRLSELSPEVNVEWPERLESREDRNACEVVLQAMSTRVSQIMASRGGVDPASLYCAKLGESIRGSVQWLDDYVSERVAAEPPVVVRFLDVSLFCLLSHLDFRESIELAEFPALQRFVEAFSSRESARITAYRYD